MSKIDQSMLVSKSNQNRAFSLDYLDWELLLLLVQQS